MECHKSFECCSPENWCDWKTTFPFIFAILSGVNLQFQRSHNKTPIIELDILCMSYLEPETSIKMDSKTLEKHGQFHLHPLEKQSWFCRLPDVFRKISAGWATGPDKTLTGHWMPEEAIVKPQVPGWNIEWRDFLAKVLFFSHG